MGAPHEMPVSCGAVIRWPDTGPMGEFASPPLLPELRFFLSFFALELEKSPGAAFTLSVSITALLALRSGKDLP